MQPFFISCSLYFTKWPLHILHLKQADMAMSITTGLKKIIVIKFIKGLLLSGILAGSISSVVSAQCTIPGNSSASGQVGGQCSPVTIAIFYKFTFGTVAPPEPSYK